MVYAGLIPWALLSKSLQSGASTFITNADIMKKVYFPRILSALGSVLAFLIDTAISFGVLLVLMVVFYFTEGFTPSLRIFLCPLVLIWTMILGLAAGLFLSKNPESEYIDRKSDIMSYMIFTPVFFANIGMTVKFDSINTGMILFGLCFILAGLSGKVIGCAGASLLCRYDFKDSVRVGLGMMARAEVALVCAQKGVENHMINSNIMPFILILIILSSFVTPMFLKMSYKKELPANAA